MPLPQKARGDRAIGLAAYEFPLVHVDMEYDIEIDTSARTPEDCADELVRWVGAGPAFRTLAKLQLPT